MIIDNKKLNCPICKCKVCQSGIRLYCESCGFEYYHNTAAAAVAAIFRNDEILLLKRAKKPGFGKLHMPGGFIMPGETLESGLAREIKEELGLNVSYMEYLFSEPNQFKYSMVKYNIVDMYYRVSVSSLSNITLDSESSWYGWFRKKSIRSEQVAFTSVIAALDKLGYIDTPHSLASH